MNSENPGRDSYATCRRLSRIDRGWPLVAAESLLGGALICFALLGYKLRLALLVAALSTLVLYALFTTIWDSGELAGNVNFGMAGRTRAAISVAGAVLLCLSLFGTVRASPSSGVLLSLGWRWVAPLLGAVGAFLLSTTSSPIRLGRNSETGVSSSFLLLAVSFLGFLLLSTGSVMNAGGPAALQDIKGWLLLVAMVSGLVSVLGEFAGGRRSSQKQ